MQSDKLEKFNSSTWTSNMFVLNRWDGEICFLSTKSHHAVCYFIRVSKYVFVLLHSVSYVYDVP